MRSRLLPALLTVAALTLAACAGDPAGAPSPSDAPTTSAPTADATSPAPTPPSPTADATSETTAPTTEQPTAAPTNTPTATAAGDCSAAGMDATADLTNLPADVRATAEFLLDAAARCDEQLLATAAAESGTTLSFGEADPYEFFGLPDEDGIYATIVTLLADLPWAAEADDAPDLWVWPRVATSEWADADGAWQEVVDAGLVTAEEADEMRAAGAGYLGWRLGIKGDGTWQYLVAGD